MRKTSGATSAVAAACGSTSESSARGLCGSRAEDGDQHEHDDALDEREPEGERELREHRLRGEPHAGGAREDEDRDGDEREEPDRRAREEVERVAEANASAAPRASEYSCTPMKTMSGRTRLGVMPAMRNVPEHAVAGCAWITRSRRPSAEEQRCCARLASYLFGPRAGRLVARAAR